MFLSSCKRLGLKVALAALCAWAGGIPSAQAQYRWTPSGPCQPAPYFVAPSYPQTVTPPTTQPGTPAPGGAATDPSTTPAPSLALGMAATGGGEYAAGDTGYIDTALPRTHFRLRYDAAYNNVRPDRAEFFYAKCGCFRVAGLDLDAGGPPELETSVDYQDVSGYLEYAFCDRFSVFAEAPYRFLNPDRNENTRGIADVNVGFKYAFCLSECSAATFQLKTYLPTGDAFEGLGTDHVSVEPGLLLWHQLTDRCQVAGEFRAWFPINGANFAGDVLRYGVGISYDVIGGCDFRVAPVAEVVGWSVLNGRELVVHFPTPQQIEDLSAEGDTIVNLKLGVRAGCRRGDVYLGYGRSLTGHTWYDDVIRVEFRLFH